MNRRSIDALLEEARAGLTRVSPAEADGEIPGALVIDRNVLEWRLAPTSDHRIPAVDDSTTVILFCDEGYASSLAAATLQELGLPRATDLIGGFQAWKREGLPVTR